MQPAHSQVLPSHGTYVSGSGAIATSGSTTTITQSSSRGVINWQSFSIGAGGKVQFDNGTGATLNRVTGGDLSQIDGQLSATGSVYLINPNGVVVGPGGRIITDGSFVASTRDVSDSQFMAGGSLRFSGTSTGGVSNAGSIVSQGGDVVLIGSSVVDSGDISAANGTAALTAGNQVVLSAASGPAGVYVVSSAASKGDVGNSGRITAAAAELASAGGNVYALAGNRGGLIQATGTQTVTGQVWLTAPNGEVSVAGTISAQNADGSGGTIVADGSAVAIGDGAVLSASGTRGGTLLVGATAAGGVNEAQNTSIGAGAQLLATGQVAGGYIETSGDTLQLGAATVNAGVGGTWLLDPHDLTIDSAAATTISNTLNASTNVVERTSATVASGFGVSSSGLGDITVAAPISWSTGATLTLSAYNSINVDAPITISGAGGLVLITNNNVGAASTGNGVLNFSLNSGNVAYTGAGGSLTINGAAYTLVSDIATLASDISGNPSGNYALANTINDSTAYTTEPITTTFTGTFEGLGNSFELKGINSSDLFVGLFAEIGSGGVVRDFSVFSDQGISGNSFLAEVGAVAGENDGAIINVHSGSSVSGSASFANDIGGLVGRNTGLIENSYATGSVSAESSAADTYVGGLVGFNSQGTISNSWATGSVTAINDGSASGFELSAGGLIGHDFHGTLAGDHASGSVDAEMDGSSSNTVGIYAGGLVGLAFENSISDSYASGTVNGAIRADVTGSSTVTMDVGGLVGESEGPVSITGSYAAGAAKGIVTGAVSTAGSIIYATGGLTGGDDGAAISEAYATGAVTGPAGGDVGGLIGESSAFATVTDAYAIGHVTGGAGSLAGGLIGTDAGTGSFTNLYWNTTTSGTNAGISGGTLAGMTGLTTQQWLTAGPIANGTFDTANTWVAGYPYPVLKALPYILVTASGTQTYGGSAPTLTITSIVDQNGDDATGLVDLSGLSYLSSIAPTDGVASGSHVVGGQGGTADSGYQLTYIGAATVTPATLTYTATGASQIYGAATPGLGGTVTGFVNGQTLNTATTGTLSFTTSAGSTSNVGSYAVDGSGLSAANYIFVQAAGNATALDITPASLTIIASDQLKTYGQTLALGTTDFSTSGLVNGDTVTGVTLTSAGAVATAGVGSSPYTINGASAVGTGLSNYTITYDTGALTVNPATLTYVANGSSQIYGSATPGLGGTVTGFVNGQTLNTATTGTLSFTTPAGPTSNVGSYAVDGSGLSAANYVFVQAAGNATALTITPAALTITASDQLKIYGQTLALGTTAFTTSGLVNGNTVTGVTLTSSGAIATAPAAGSPYAIDPSGAVGTGLSNYTITYLPGLLTVQNAVVTFNPPPPPDVLAPPLQQAPWNGDDWLHATAGNGLAPLPETIAVSDPSGVVYLPDEASTAAEADAVRRAGNGRRIFIRLPAIAQSTDLQGGQ